MTEKHDKDKDQDARVERGATTPATGSTAATNPDGPRANGSPTPGPWTLWEEHGGFNITVPGAVLCQRAAWSNRAAESAANGRLMVAAPELFAALTDVCRMIEIGWIPPDDLDEFKPEGIWEKVCEAFRDSRAYTVARDVLAKAEGR